MPRFFYSLLCYLAQPLVWLRLLWRARRQPEYLHHLGERYGFYPQTTPGRLLWLHVVSVGETRAAERGLPLCLMKAQRVGTTRGRSKSSGTTAN